MNKETEDIKVIREMMEKSSKFFSLNGLSLVFAGIIACTGAAFEHFYRLKTVSMIYYFYPQNIIVIADAFVIFLLAVGVITWFCWRKSKKNYLPLFNNVTRNAAYSLLIPLITGGVLAVIFLIRNAAGMTAPITLIFYGLALLNASKYTFKEIHYLGICEIIVGLLAAIFIYHGLLFWTIGFGILHIIFGFFMYFKHDR
ncbi:hypothetical protein FACS189432_07590 [Bacteroidia bacterium]|nr:hypothetical protein FACS189426_15650 [Bacteroidia bacterium]GHT28948.1 hypothetical protein FACS189432_07590 [Bacteroidia bacterium]